MICIYTEKLFFSRKYTFVLYNPISKITLPWYWLEACLKLWKFQNLTKYAKRFLIGTRSKICSDITKASTSNANWKHQTELNWNVKLQSTLFKNQGDSGFMFGASLDRQYCPDVIPVFGNPSHISRKTTQIFKKLGSNQARVDKYGKLKWNSC